MGMCATGSMGRLGGVHGPWLWVAGWVGLCVAGCGWVSGSCVFVCLCVCVCVWAKEGKSRQRLKRKSEQ